MDVNDDYLHNQFALPSMTEILPCWESNPGRPILNLVTTQRHPGCFQS